MPKREPLWQWYARYTPAPRSTVVKDHDIGAWRAFRRGDLDGRDFDTWQEAIRYVTGGNR